MLTPCVRPHPLRCFCLYLSLDLETAAQLPALRSRCASEKLQALHCPRPAPRTVVILVLMPPLCWHSLCFLCWVSQPDCSHLSQAPHPVALPCSRVPGSAQLGPDVSCCVVAAARSSLVSAAPFTPCSSLTTIDALLSVRPSVFSGGSPLTLERKSRCLRWPGRLPVSFR